MTSEATSSQPSSQPQPVRATFISDQPKPEDHLDFRPYVTALTELISSPQTMTPITLGLFGSWGSGKTQLMMLIDENLRERRKSIELELKRLRRNPLRYAFSKRRGDKAPEALEPLWINVWQISQQNSGEGSGWQAFLQALFSQVHDRIPIGRRLWFDLKLLVDRVDVPEVFRQLLANSYRLVIVLAPLLLAKLPPLQNPSPGVQDSLTGLLQNPSFGSALSLSLGLWLLFKPLIEAAKEKISLDLEKILKDAPYEMQISAIQQLQTDFECLIKAWVNDDGRVVVFIDDLDRCPPDKMTEVLEALKLFATTQGCVYVLGADQEVVAQSIRAKYKDLPIDGVRYLEKVVQLPFLLPSIEVSDIEGYVKSFKAGWPHDGCQDIFVKGLPPNPRQIKRAINVFFLLWSLAESRRDKLGGTVTPMRLAKIVALQTAHPEVFERMKLAPWLIKRIEEHLLKGSFEREKEIETKLLDESLHLIVRQPLIQQLFTLHSDDPLAIFGKLDDTDLAAFFSLTRRVQAATAEATPPTVTITDGVGEPKKDVADTKTVVVSGDHIVIQKPSSPTVSSLHQLPPPPRDFTGREQELNEMVKRVGESNNLVISGPAGVGKSAFALTVAERVKDSYPDAQFFLDLRGFSKGPVSATEAMTHVIRGYYPEAKLPDNEAELQGLYQSVLNGKRALILLDNAESEEQVKPLVPPQSCLLIVTSRRRFSQPGALSLGLETLSAEASRELLLKIAPRIGERAGEIAELCGGLLLALRLAASTLAERLDLSPDDYLHRLRGEAKERRELIAASLSLSYEMLTAEEQKQLRALSVFQSGFDEQAAVAVCQADRQVAQDLLGELVKLSLVEFDEGQRRYSLHNLSQLFARELLDKAGESESVERRHSTYYRAALAQADVLYLSGGESITQSLALFDRERENIRAGQRWAESRAADDDEAAQLCIDYPNAGAYVLDLRQHPRERIHWMEAALSAARRLNRRDSEGNLLGNLGLAYADLGEVRKAVEFYEQALAANRETGDRKGEGAILGNLGLAYADFGHTLKAVEFYEQQLAIARELGDRLSEGNALGNLGLAYFDLGEVQKAIEFQEQRLSISREIGDLRSEGNALGNLAAFYAGLGETKKAVELIEQQLIIVQEIGDRRGEAAALFNLSLAVDELKDRARAVKLAESALTIFQEIEDSNADKVQKQLAKWQTKQ